LSLGYDLLKFIEEGSFKERELLEEFWEQFKSLMEVIDEEVKSKKLIDNAKTNVFPLRSLLPESVNLTILYATRIVYCLARFTIIALAFSCLKSMPELVYMTTFVIDVPSVQ
jgi:hypothetical protein